MKRRVNGGLSKGQPSLFMKNGHDKRPVLITGGAGFIGTNVADRFLSGGYPVIIYDNISRPGVEQNLRWLQETYGHRVQLEVGDMRDGESLRSLVAQVSKVFHFAAQVAVTTSLTAPINDFEINARGTLNLLEALRATNNPPPLIYTSTNKVYGHLGDVEIHENGDRYEPVDRNLRNHGFDEKRPLDFHSPYGCSKGAAEQYVLDYARTFKLPALVFRMSCIYGLHQFGNEDQGWVAHFLIRALQEKPITIYGDGKQVRDVLFVEDLVDAFLLAHKHMRELSGRAFNIGGGPGNTISLLELLNLITKVNGAAPSIEFDAWRPADQQYYVSDIRRFSVATGWAPKVGVLEGVERLHGWLLENHIHWTSNRRRGGRPIVVLDEDKQQEVIQSLEHTREPRSKRLWQANHGNGFLSRAGGKNGR